MRRGVAFAAVVVVALGGARAGAQGVSAGELRQAIFPRANGATRELGIRDEENRPLYLASFEWARWPKGPPQTYVALAVATTERGVGPGVGCDRQRAAVPGGVLLAVVRREKVRIKWKTVTKLRMVGHDSRQVTLGCDDGTATDAITLDAGPYRLSDGEQGVAVRRQTTSPGGRSSEEVRLYRFVTEVRVVLETEHPLRDGEREYQVTLAPAKTRTKGLFDLVLRVTARPLQRGAEAAGTSAPATQPTFGPATQPASPRARPGTTVFRWNGSRYVPGK